MKEMTEVQGPVKLPRDIRTAGVLRAEAVVGRILSMEPRPLNQFASSQSPASQGAGTGVSSKGNFGKSKGKKGQAKGPRSDTVLEIYLCGGAFPADVLLFEVWEEAVRHRIQKCASVGATVRLSKVAVVGHTDKTRWYTTSPAPVYLKARPETTVELIKDEPAYSDHHPVTPIASLPLLAPRSSVCVAGCVVEKGEVRRVNTPEGETDVTNLILRSGNDAVRVHFWRETIRLLEDVREGELVFLCGVAKQFPKSGMDPKDHVELRATVRTHVSHCPDKLRDTLRHTPAVLEGAKCWYPAPAGGEKKDYEAADATWMSLSVLYSLCSSGAIRDIRQVFEVPSVFLEFASGLTYKGCSKCHRAWRDDSGASCACGDVRVALWRTKLGLRDATGQLQATCFGAIAAVVSVYAAGAGEPVEISPDAFSTDEMAGKVASYIAAVPFTVRLTVAADGYKDTMQATVHLLEPTFRPDGVLHPLKPVVHLGPGVGACPPFLLETTKYASGLGVTEALGSAFDFFRGYVRFVDNPVQSDVRGHVQRHICCVRGTTNYVVDFKGDAAQAERLAQAPTGSHAHALLAWHGRIQTSSI